MSAAPGASTSMPSPLLPPADHGITSGAGDAGQRWPQRGGEPAVRLASLVAFVALWQVAAAWSGASLLPTPEAVMRRLAEEWQSGVLPGHLQLTLLRVAAAFTLAMVLGAALGMVMGRWRWLDRFFDGWLVLGLNIPALVTIILCYVWFGLNDVAAVVAVALNKLPTVVVTVREGARAVDHDLLRVGAAYRLSRARVFWRIYLPQLAPWLLAAARGGLALIWKIVLVVELLGRSNGVGFQLNVFFQFFDLSGILAYTLAFAAVVLAIEGLVLRPLERRLMRWRR